MKNIVVIYHGEDWERTIPITNDASRIAFEELHTTGLLNGLNMFRASIKWFDLKSGTFKKAWAFRDGKWIKLSGPIKPDLILDKLSGKHDADTLAKKQSISKVTKIYNDPLFRMVIDNKLNQYLIFGEFMPKSLLISSEKELRKYLEGISSKKLVLKPPYGSGGFGIFIGTKKEMKYNVLAYPLMLQEFVAGTGIPGLSTDCRLADLRMIYMNGKLLYALSRIAKKGSLFTNFHQGATPVLVSKNSIPKSVIDLAEKINVKLRLFPRAEYSLDFIFDKKETPYLVELNTTPGLDLLKIVGDKKLILDYLKEIKKLAEWNKP